MVFYDSNVPEYNKFRYVAPSSVDTLNRVSILFTNVPSELSIYILAGLALALDVNVWQGDYQDRQAIVDLFNEVNVMYDICDVVADCIANDNVVRKAIADYAGANFTRIQTGIAGDDNATASQSSVYNQEYLEQSCDEDVIFGQVTGLVDLANTVITDLYERFEVSTTGLERANLFASGVPAVGLLPVDELIEFVDSEFENLFQGYEGAYTAQLRDEYRCDLFCLALDNGCTLTLKQIAEYFRARSGAAILDGLTFKEMFSYFFTGTFGGSLISHASHYMLFATLAFSARFLNFDSFYFSRAIRSFANDPDPDWQVLCDECPPTGGRCYEWNFIDSQQGWNVWSTQNRPYGDYVSGVGWRCEFVNIDGQDDNAIYIENINFPDNIVPTRFEVDVIGTAGGGARSIKVRTTNGTSNNSSATFPQYARNGLLETLSVDYDQVGDGVRINVNTAVTSSDNDAVVVVAVRLYYQSGTAQGGAAC